MSQDFDSTKEAGSLHALLGELEAALVRIKKRGDDCTCSYWGACGCGGACAEIASEALDSMRGRLPSNSVPPLGQTADLNYNQGQIQDLINKLHELITTLRR